MPLRVPIDALPPAAHARSGRSAPGLARRTGGVRLPTQIAIAALTVYLGGTAPAVAQPADELRALRKEIETLKEGQAAIRREIQEIKDALRARDARDAPPPAPQNIALSLDGAPLRGDSKARLVLVDFTDYQ
jgi:hypothetical protein